ncbi:ABC transporter permease [Paenibacillus crassostreae]|uniref:Putative hemin transport system permease protein HrtB n=1 Tax=Paenibacillus crassostreae TaxID=1763538 RepID=A0A167FIW0_9BACL|nr:FtsX-like permease family protein [Paenibacillus crassostreae]AOZ94360.1 ABC transporter permease [Paenibacillus crassostreae]OAB76603.1 ABC transporter permease [Paenibacillus crassostreae]
MSIYRLLIRNIWHRKFLSLLTICSIAVTVAFIVLLSLSQESVEQGAKKGYGPFDVVIGADGSETQLVLNTFYHVGAPTGNIPESILATVKKDPQIEQAYPMTTGDHYNGYPIVGIDAEYFLTRYGDQNLDSGGLYKQTGEVVVGAYVARTLGIHLGDTFAGSHGLIDQGVVHEDEEHGTEEHGEEHHEEDSHASFGYTVVGILPSLNTPDDRALFTTVDYAWAVHETTDDHKEITAILVKPKSLLGAQSLKTELDQYDKVQAVYTSKAVADVVNLVDSGAQIVSVVTGLCIVLAAISVLLSLIAAVNERTKDVGLLRLLGKSKLYVWMTLIGEGVLLTTTGLIIGLIMGHIGGFVLREALFEYGGIQINPLLWTTSHIYIVIGTIAIGLLASIGPAYKTYRMNPLTLFKA